MRRLRRRLRDVAKSTFLRKWIIRRRERKERQEVIGAWRSNKSPIPPPEPFKHETLISYARKYGLSILIETGTHVGDTIAAVEHVFDRVYTIELDDALYGVARKRFKQLQKIETIQGDSAVMLGKLMGKIDQPALFWLDGHYSGHITARGEKETPISEELTHIFNDYDTAHNAHVILIDDARDFGNRPDYPSLEEIHELVISRLPGYDFRVESDIIRITPSMRP